jgi:polyribonucleotide nucleotidyltransferase
VHYAIYYYYCSASAALCLSHVPLTRAVAGVTVAMDASGAYIINPDNEIAAASRLNLTLAGTADVSNTHNFNLLQ